MIRKLLGLLTLMAAALAIGAVSPAQAADYGGPLPTETQVSVSVEGQTVTVHFWASANTSDSSAPTGTLVVEITTASASARTAIAPAVSLRTGVAGRASGTVVRSGTYRFDGSPITVKLSGLKKGTYVASASFTPDNADRFLPSTGQNTFRVGASALQATATADDTDTDALSNAVAGLVNTGGPDRVWLILALALLGVGSVGMYVGRRRVRH
ncbi:hypothetical protein [Nocardioides sp. Kera G14]|uniref:hypothetical protein n=1 Tax=Nocardioides sp. Kera G14 TaxID=2884264 RepID=UPI001D101930|nr:hypothetical protein [Nocardioides sp. Kera G14]UDY23609.1 hypothetical protein LH076_16350 [Nocardioides sp. Kera G14]